SQALAPRPLTHAVFLLIEPALLDELAKALLAAFQAVFLFVEQTELHKLMHAVRSLAAGFRMPGSAGVSAFLVCEVAAVLVLRRRLVQLLVSVFDGRFAGFFLIIHRITSEMNCRKEEGRRSGIESTKAL